SLRHCSPPRGARGSAARWSRLRRRRTRPAWRSSPSMRTRTLLGLSAAWYRRWSWRLPCWWRLALFRRDREVVGWRDDRCGRRHGRRLVVEMRPHRDHALRDRLRGGIALRTQRARDRHVIVIRLVLVELEVALDRFDRHFDRHNRFEEHFATVVGHLGERPDGLRREPFLEALAQPLGMALRVFAADHRHG